MTRTFRFLLGRFWPCLAAMAVLAAAAAGSQALWLPPWTRTVFQWCFALLPKLLPSVLLFAGFFPWGRSMNLALSMGAGRRGLFGAVHLLFLVLAAAAWAVQRAVCALPAPFLPAMAERFPALAPAEAASPWVYFLLCLMMLLLGSVCGIHGSRTAPHAYQRERLIFPGAVQQAAYGEEVQAVGDGRGAAIH